MRNGETKDTKGTNPKQNTRIKTKPHTNSYISYMYKILFSNLTVMIKKNVVMTSREDINLFKSLGMRQKIAVILLIILIITFYVLSIQLIIQL